ncbi:GGDEF domain-containing protein [Alteromonas sp. A081]|uniref:GGDEF domain-containing protein n=1 Tax=Alteromonas sp. A081 TaxID=3410269 RepID=UPI003B97D8C2
MKDKILGLTWWYKEFPYTKFSEDYWRVRLIQHTLLLACLLFSILALINVFAFDDTRLALIDSAGFMLSLAVYFGFRKTGNITLTAWLISLTVTTMMLLFLISVEGRAYSLVWATIILPFTFFLLGRRGGTLLSSITLCVCIYLVYTQVESGIPITLSTGALLNVIEAAIVQLLLFRFYEGTRQKTFDQLKAEHRESKRLSETDYLTGVYNRSKFLSLVDSLLASNNANHHCMVILDLDDFKLINDKYGHNTGDTVLKEFAKALRAHTREGDIIARWGGEEFVLLLTNVNLSQATGCINQLLSVVQHLSIVDNAVSFSAGITQCDRVNAIDELVRIADEALYQAKRDGKGRVYIAQ